MPEYDGRVDSPTLRLKPLSLVLAVIGLAGAACGLTLLYLGMREVMEIGGACAEGGAYEIAQPCPDGVPGLMIGGIFGGLVCLAIFGVAAGNLGGGYNRLVLWAWPALFLSLGWNFLDYGLDPPAGGGGASVGWLVCAGLFFLMGGLPLLFLLHPSQLRRTFWPRVQEEPEQRAAVDDPPGPSRPYPAARGPGATAFITDALLPRPGAAKGPDDMVGRLERLARLHADGALDAAEYERAKHAVLQGRAS